MKNTKKLSIVALFLLVSVGAGLWYLHIHRPKTVAPSTNQNNGPTPAQKQQEADSNALQKKQVIEKGSTDPQPPTNQPVTSSISLSAQQESNSTVTVFTKLTNISSGSCELTVTNGSAKTSQTANVIYQPEFSTCAGFSVPITSVGKGTWLLNLTITSDGTSQSKSISTEVK